jgi:DNA-binding response OmpR family regulator
MSGPRVLVIEDDADIWRSLQVLLKRSGYEAIWADDGVEGLRRFGDDHPDLILLDVGLPVLDGWAVLERIRNVSHVPILVLTARGLEMDKARGLLGGADDYLTKPFSNGELVARIGALLRHSPVPSAKPTMYDDGVLEVDFTAGTVRVHGESVKLTPTELRLLTALVQRAGQVLSSRQLLETVWNDPSGTGPGRVKFTVLSVRRKLGWNDLKDCPLENVRGFGYRYRRPD